MPDFDELLSEFGSGTKPKPSARAVGAFDALLSEFGQSGYTAERKDGVTVIKPQKLGDPGFTAEMQTSLPEGKGGQRKGIVEGIASLPSNYVENFHKDFKSAKSMASEGVDEISQGKSATGVGKTLMGTVLMPLSLVTAAGETLVTEPIAQVTGNRDLAEKVSAVAGAALPVVPAGNAVRRAMPRNRAFQTLVDTIEPKNISSVVAELKSNPRLTLMDVSPAAKQMAQQLVVTEGKHLNHLSNVVEQRLGSAKGVVGDIYDNALGTPVNVVDKLNEYKKNIREVGQKQINPVVAAAKPVDLSGVIKEIDDIVKPNLSSVVTSGQLPEVGVKATLQQMRGLLTNDKAVRIGADDIHKLQAAFRAKGQELLNSSDGSKRLEGAAYMRVRNSIVDAIDKATDGKYKPTLKAYRDEIQIDEAFHVGSNIISNSKKLENRPEYFAEWKKGASKEELEAAREGARVAIDTQIRTAKNAARAGIDVVMPDFSATKIKELFGQAEADRMIKLLRDEQRIADTNSKLFQQSQTAMRTAVNSKIALPTKSDVVGNMLPPAVLEAGSAMAGGAPLVGTAAYIGAKGVGAGKDAIKRRLAAERNFQLSKMVTAGDGPLRDRLIQELEAVAAAKPRLLTRASNALTNVISP